MRYQQVIPGRFIDRPNRFIAHVETEDGIQRVHVKNTGRCRELLTPGARVLLQRAENAAGSCCSPASPCIWSVGPRPTARRPMT